MNVIKLENFLIDLFVDLKTNVSLVTCIF